MRSLIGLTGVFVLAFFSHAEAATLNKCIDAKGEVTYSNLPCRNAREVRTLEIDPAPPSDPEVQPIQAHAAKSAKPVAPAKEPVSIRLGARKFSEKSVSRASTRKCDTLTDKLGQVVDKMDRAHRKGYTQKQMDAWNQEVRDLERKKQQSGCF